MKDDDLFGKQALLQYMTAVRPESQLDVAHSVCRASSGRILQFRLPIAVAACRPAWLGGGGRCDLFVSPQLPDLQCSPTYLANSAVVPHRFLAQRALFAQVSQSAESATVSRFGLHGITCICCITLALCPQRLPERP